MNRAVVRRNPIRRTVQPRWIADAMPRRARHDLVWLLVIAGRTDTEIAEQTAMTTYTTARIRDSLGLAPNNEKGRPAWPSPSASATRSCVATTTPADTAAGPPPTYR